MLGKSSIANAVIFFVNLPEILANVTTVQFENIFIIPESSLLCIFHPWAITDPLPASIYMSFWDMKHHILSPATFLLVFMSYIWHYINLKHVCRKCTDLFGSGRDGSNTF